MRMDAAGKPLVVAVIVQPDTRERAEEMTIEVDPRRAQPGGVPASVSIVATISGRPEPEVVMALTVGEVEQLISLLQEALVVARHPPDPWRQ